MWLAGGGGAARRGGGGGAAADAADGGAGRELLDAGALARPDSRDRLSRRGCLGRQTSSPTQPTDALPESLLYRSRGWRSQLRHGADLENSGPSRSSPPPPYSPCLAPRRPGRRHCHRDADSAAVALEAAGAGTERTATAERGAAGKGRGEVSRTRTRAPLKRPLLAPRREGAPVPPCAARPLTRDSLRPPAPLLSRPARRCRPAPGRDTACCRARPPCRGAGSRRRPPRPWRGQFHPRPYLTCSPPAPRRYLLCASWGVCRGGHRLSHSRKLLA